MATLSAAGQWTSLLLFLPNTIMQAVLPIFSASVADTSDVKAFAKTLNLTQSLMVLIAFPCCTALMFSADWLMGVYWKTTAGESVVLIACLLASLIQCLGAAAGPAIQAKSRMWFAFAINLSWGVIYVAFTAVFVGALGATAVAFGQVVAYFLGTIWVFLYIRSDLPAGLLSRILLGLIFACFIAALCLATPAPMRIWLALPATLAATVAALHSLINPELRKDIRTALIWSKLRS
jgi:O-antigen/teichoic acid export membrane protein